MSQVDADRNLLFGVLALQLELIDAPVFAGVCGEWAARKDVTLAQLLVDRGSIAPEDRQQVEALLERKLKKHGGDVHATLGAVADVAARDAIRQVDDSEIRKSVSTLSPTAGFVFTETSTPTNQEPRSRYSLTRLHAEGGLGKVWLAHDSDLNREVALKEIQPHQAQHPEAWRRFIKEAQVTGQLEHPNIVPVYELARRALDDQPFYTMRFVRGRTLRQAIADMSKADPLTLPKQLQAFISVCQAIGYAHSRGVIHRDLKPENVVLGGFGEVLVLDWGLAKMVDRPDDAQEVALTEEAETEATRAGSLSGTPAYMAPEQAEGRLDLIDTRTDIYGLGGILFEILVGRPPHQGGNTIELFERIISGATPRARDFEPATPPALDAICAKAMAKERAGRYGQASELAEDVQRWLADEPVSVYREDWRTWLARWARRHRAWAQAGAMALLSLIVVLVVAWFLVETQRQRAVDAATAANLAAIKAKALAARLALSRGISLCEQGDVARGLLCLARGLQVVPTQSAELQQSLRWNLGKAGAPLLSPPHQLHGPSRPGLRPDVPARREGPRHGKRGSNRPALGCPDGGADRQADGAQQAGRLSQISPRRPSPGYGGRRRDRPALGWRYRSADRRRDRSRCMDQLDRVPA